MKDQNSMTLLLHMNSERVQNSMKIQLTSFTKAGGILCKRLRQELVKLGYEAEGCCKYATDDLMLLTEDVRTHTKKAFENCNAVIFIGAAGIAVRAIAPYIRSKDSDPAVLVIDEKGRYVIPVLSGHMGGANSLAVRLADILSAQPVITTATDINRKFAVDSWAEEHGCFIANIENIKYISAAILRDETVGLYSDFPVDGSLPEYIDTSDNAHAGICISREYKKKFSHTLHLIPKQYVLGIGCRKNTAYENLLEVVNSVLCSHGILACEVGAVASIDIKAGERALIMLAKHLKIPFYTYSARELSEVQGSFSQSDFVRETTGVDNVCERAAVKAGNGRLAACKYSRNGITVAIAQKEWRCSFEDNTGIFGS